MEEHTEESIDTDRILVGVDGSRSSIDALRYAARIASAFDAPLEVVTSWYYPPYMDYTVVTEWSPEEEAQLILQQAVEDAFGSAPPEGMKRTLYPGPPARTLIKLSETAGMLVLGSRGHGGFAGLLLGSVSAACAEHAHCPVLIVHGRSAAEPADAGEQEERR